MKKLKSSLAAKITAVILFVFFLAATLGGVVCISYMADEGFYDPNGFSFYSSGTCAGITSGYANTIYYDYLSLALEQHLSAEDSFRLKQYQEKFSKENTNFFFTVTDENGRVVLTNYEEQDYGIQKTYAFDLDEKPYDEAYVVNAYVKNPITAKDNYYRLYQIFNTLYSMRYVIIAAVALFAILAVLLFIFLLSSAGHRKGKEEIVLNSFDKFPLDICAIIISIILLFLLNISINYYGMSFAVKAVFTGVAIIAAALLTLALCMTFAVRAKAGKWWENTVLCFALKMTLRACRQTAKTAGILAGNLPLLWKTILAFAGFAFVNVVTFVLFMDTGLEAVFFLFGLLFNLAALLGLCFLMLQMQKLKQAGEKIAAGDYGSKINTKNMYWDIKAHAEALNNIGAGMSRAVEERLKSERLKTELITNVSHDIKTPLTSIVNYVDLLKKENIESENALKYIEVLDRQSARLKKLTEDLLEASKASTGNLSVNFERMDVAEFLNQSIGEYAERFTACRLEAVIRAPQNETAIWADGRLMWRVFDNLLNNICKYSLSNTRVYFDVEHTRGRVKITLKNISRLPLNITPDELMERFVRGDSARTTEGSGLGLSIAKSLTELQKGSFHLSVDGDLFKVVIGFDGMNCC